jgi:DNA-binding GntR family transcriptional regulator
MCASDRLLAPLHQGAFPTIGPTVQPKLRPLPSPEPSLTVYRAYPAAKPGKWAFAANLCVIALRELSGSATFLYTRWMHNPQKINGELGGVSTEVIVERITTAVLEQRLPLGAKLGEEKLCAAFGVSRTKVRQALNRLARSKLVVLKPRRGAFLAEPTHEEARQIFQARRVIESEIFEQFTKSATEAELAALERHNEAERRAIESDDAPLRNRLLGTFHVRIAEMVGNRVLTDIVTDLVTRSSLITLLLQSAQAASCSCDDHRVLIEAIRARKIPLVRKLLHEHLDYVERNLADIESRRRDFDLVDALRDPASDRRRTRAATQKRIKAKLASVP